MIPLDVISSILLILSIPVDYSCAIRRISVIRSLFLSDSKAMKVVLF